jgi:hypothetical protein
MTFSRQSLNEPIAIIGSGCRFPGDANSPSKLWDLLSNPRDVSSRIGGAGRFNLDRFCTYRPPVLNPFLVVVILCVGKLETTMDVD